MSRTMNRAALLLDANYYQDQGDQALMKVQELQRQVQELQADCQTMQTSIQDLVVKAEERLEELREIDAQEAEAAAGRRATASSSSTAQSVIGQQQSAADRQRLIALRDYQEITWQIEQGRLRVTTTLDRIVTLRAQQRRPEQQMQHCRERFNSILYRLAPPPRGSGRDNPNPNNNPGSQTNGVEH